MRVDLEQPRALPAETQAEINEPENWAEAEARKELGRLVKRAGWNAAKGKEYMKKEFDKAASKDLTYDEVETMVTHLTDLLKDKFTPTTIEEQP